MTDIDKEIFAQIKYEGNLVEDGYLDAKKAGEVLIGIDNILRYFLYQEDKKFKKIDFEIPVRIKKGSWVTEFLANYDAVLIKTALTWGASKYFGSALSEMAKKDFKDVGFKDIFKKAFKGLTWVLKIAQHLGTLTKKKFENLNFSKNNRYVILINDRKESLEVPIEYLELFVNCPDDLFVNLAKIIEDERELVVLYNDIEKEKQNYVKIGTKSKKIFIPNDEDDETLFPDLVHDQFVELEGHITRGNENSNTIGFMYEGHILTCWPQKGNVKNFKSTLFTNCTLRGYVDRLNKKTGEYIEKRPRIRFLEIISNEPEDRQKKLF